MSQETRNQNGRRLLLGLCVAVFSILLYVIYISEPQQTVQVNNKTLETQTVNDDLVRANREYLNEIEKLQSEMERLKSQHGDATDIFWKAKIEDLTDFIDAHDKETEALETKIAELNDVTIQKQEEIERKQDEILALKDQLMQQEEVDLRWEAMERAEGKLYESQLKVSSLEHQLAEKQQNLEEHVAELAQLESHVKKGKDELLAVQNQVETLKEQFVKQESIFRNQLETKQTNLQESREELFAMQELLTQKGEDYDAERDKVREKEEELMAAQDQLEALKKQIALQEENHELELELGRTNLKKNREELMALQRHLELKEEDFRAELESERNQLRESENNLLAAQKQIQGLKDHLAEQEKQQREIIDAERSQLQESREELMTLQSQLAQKDEHLRAELEAERSQLREVQEDLFTTRNQIELLRDNFNRTETELQSLLESERDEARIRLQDNADDLLAAQGQIEALQGKISHKDEMFRASLEFAEEKKQELRETLNNIRQENENLANRVLQIAILEEQLQKTTEKADMARNALEKSENNNQELRKTETLLKSELAQLKQDKKTLLKALDENAQTFESLEAERDTLDQRIADQRSTHQAQKAKLDQDMEQVNKRNEQLIARIEGLELELSVQSEKMKELIVYERKYEEEKKKRLIKEQVLKQLQAHLEHNKRSLSEIETNRQNLTDELELTQRSYSQLAKELAKRKPAPGVIEDIVMTEPQNHVVAEGETLMHISKKYYGTTRKWRHIFEANRGVIPDENKIRPGTEIIIP